MCAILEAGDPFESIHPFLVLQLFLLLSVEACFPSSPLF